MGRETGVHHICRQARHSTVRRYLGGMLARSLEGKGVLCWFGGDTGGVD